jgi:hypothetical protein
LSTSITTSRCGGRCFLRQHDVVGWLLDLTVFAGTERFLHTGRNDYWRGLTT